MQGPRKRPFAFRGSASPIGDGSCDGSRLGCENPAARAEALMGLSPVDHFFAALAGQHFEHALDTAHARGDECSVVIIEVAAPTGEVGAFRPTTRQCTLGIADFDQACEPGIVD